MYSEGFIRMSVSRILICVFFIMPAAQLHTVLAADAPSITPNHRSTDWEVHPSFKYDTLCFLNILTGDEFYTRFYETVYADFEPRLTPEVRKALAAVKRSIKDEGGGIVSANLSLYYSVSPAETLDELIEVTENPAAMKAAFSKTRYYDAEEWQDFDAVRADLVVIFRFLKKIDFPGYWHQEVKPAVMKRAAEVRGELKRYNIVPLQESILGHPLESNRIQVYMLRFNRPHGMRITGTRFLTGESYPISILLMTAMHEMLHPPFNYEADDELRAVLEALKKDEFLMQRVENHNPSFGYNTFEGFMNEDIVQASDQLIGEAVGNPLDPKQRWLQSDDGMHVLAVALYMLAHRENYDLRKESMRDFIVRMGKTGKLGPDRIEPLYRSMYPDDDEAQVRAGS